MRRLEIYVRKYGPVLGPKLYRSLQSQAAHAGVSARLRRKIERMSGQSPVSDATGRPEVLPLFPDTEEHLKPVVNDGRGTLMGT